MTAASMSLWGRHAQGPEREVPLVDIDVGKRLRDIGEGAVADLMVSIAETGLIQPIVLRAVEAADGELSLRLVAGAHRLEAHRRLGREAIRARVVDLTELDARQAEIDENIVRSQPGGWERISFLARRAEVYAERHPEAVRAVGDEGARGRGRPRKDQFVLDAQNGRGRHIPSIMGFATEVADQTGLARNTIQRDAQIWAALHPFDAQIRKLAIARDNKALRQLASIASMAERAQVIESLATGCAGSVSEAIAIAAGNTPVKPAKTAADVAVKAFKSLWNAASASAREAVLTWLADHLPKGWVLEKRS